MQATRKVIEIIEIELNLSEDEQFTIEDECRWFLGCTRPATTSVNHPILGEVPCCDKCADFAADK